MEDDLTLAGLVNATPGLSVLGALAGTAGATAVLDDDARALTLFAPTDAAFTALAVAFGFEGDTDDPQAVADAVVAALGTALEDTATEAELANALLSYHLLGTPRTAPEIAASEDLPTLLENTGILPAGNRLIDFDPDALDAEIALGDVVASNGILHVVDAVLLPADLPGNEADSIAEIVAAEFAVLDIALAETGLVELVADDNAEFTLFAPTDAAFAGLAAEFGFTGDPEDAQAVFDAVAAGLGEIAPEGADPLDLLAEILLYHLSTGARGVASLETGPAVQTARLGTGVVVSETEGVFDNDPDRDNARLVDGGTDLAASNGVVHAVDAVLLPVDLEDPAAEPTLADLLDAEGGFDGDATDFDILARALSDAGVLAALTDTEATFTLLAPTDAAFAAFAGTLGAAPETEAETYDAVVEGIATLLDGGDPLPLLSTVLLYHVIDGAETRADLATGPALESLIGPAPVTDGRGAVDDDRGIADAAFVDAGSDTVAANGLLHPIDRVMLPINLPDASDEFGTEGDDVLTIGPETLLVNGGPGTDRAEAPDLALAATGVGSAEGGFLLSTADRTIEVLDIETIVFSDATVEVTDDALAASVFRLYGVGLGRPGDIAGVTFWAEAAARDGLGLVADAILASDEFAAQFDGVPGPDEIVGAFYENFLGREGDEAGLAFWQEAVAAPDFDESDLLLAFSESTEFRALTQGQTDDGVLLLA